MAQKIVLSEIKKDEKVRNREGVRKHRQKNRQNAVQVEVQNLVAFKSPQSLGKAKKKVLPNSPRKRTAEIAALATDAGLGTLKNRRLDNTLIG